MSNEQDVSWEILDGAATLTLTPQDDSGLLLEFDDEDGDQIYAESRERGFWNSRTATGEICNDIAEHIPQTKAEVKVALKEIWAELSENDREYRRALLNPSVEELIAQTERVEVHGGSETEFEVFITAQPYGKRRGKAQSDGGAETRKLTFSNSEWMREDGDVQTPAVAKKYNNVFYKPLDINWQQWRDDIRPAWVEMQEIITDDHQTTAERIAMSAVRSLRKRLDVHADKSRIINDTWNGWWDDQSREETVIWVPSDTLTEILDEHNKDGDYLGALSRATQQEGFTAGGRRQTSIDGNPINLYPFPATVLGVQEIDVIGLDTDDDRDGEGEANDGDGGDGGGGDGSDNSESIEDEDENDTDSNSDDESGNGTSTSTDTDTDSGNEGNPTDDPLNGVVEAVAELDDGDGVGKTELIATMGQRRDMPPDEAKSLIEDGILSGRLFRPNEDGETVARRPGGGEPAGKGELPLDAEGVPDP